MKELITCMQPLTGCLMIPGQIAFFFLKHECKIVVWWHWLGLKF